MEGFLGTSLEPRERHIGPRSAPPVSSPSDSLPPHPRDPALAADLRLVQRALAGERGAIQELGQRLSFVPGLVRYLDARRGQRLDAVDLEDLSQSALAKIWQRLPSYAGTGNVEAWAQRFVRYEFMNEWRRRGMRRRPTPLEPELVEAEERVSEPSDELVHCLSRLDQSDVEILRLKNVENLTLPDIAERFGLPVNTVKSRYYRTLARLRDMLPGHVRESLQ